MRDEAITYQRQARALLEILMASVCGGELAGTRDL